MTPERLARIEQLFHAARERAPETREAYLDAECFGDVELRGEVESLLWTEESLVMRTAGAAEPSLTETGQILGTPHCVSPEQARGKDVDRRCDIYSLGIVLYEMLTGVRPFVGATSFEVVAKHIHDPFPDPRTKKPFTCPKRPRVWSSG